LSRNCAPARREFFIAIARTHTHTHTHVCTRLIRQLFPAAKVMSRTCSDLTSLYIQSVSSKFIFTSLSTYRSWNFAASYSLSIFSSSVAFYIPIVAFFIISFARQRCIVNLFLGASMIFEKYFFAKCKCENSEKINICQKKRKTWKYKLIAILGTCKIRIRRHATTPHITNDSTLARGRGIRECRRKCNRFIMNRVRPSNTIAMPRDELSMT